MSASPYISIVIEFENATTVAWDRVAATFKSLAAQLTATPFPSTAGDRAPEIICVHPGVSSDSEPLCQRIVAGAKSLEVVADLRCIALPGGRYYELKNHGIREARGELVVLIDSDVVPEDDWLVQLLGPFDNPETVAVAGHTFLGNSDLISRTLALVWVFPLRDRDQTIDRRPLVANNCAFRGDWLKANSFPEDDGFKVSCSLLANRLESCGHALVRVPARACHAPLSGFRFLVWRALVTGRDADRKVMAFKGTALATRMVRALKHGLKMELRAIRRVLAHYHHVSLPLWQVPFALGIGLSFYGLALVSQVLQAAGLTAPRIERVPDYVEAH